VHIVVSRGREYFYFQAARGTSHEGKRVRLPDDPQTPEFWRAIRAAQGVPKTDTGTINALVDAYRRAENRLRGAPAPRFRPRRE
jgi:hypothetical protein